MGEWEHGIFGCFDDIKLCAISYLFPCVTTGRTAEALGTDSCFMGGCKLFIPIYNLCWLKGQRDAIIAKKGLNDEGMMGWVNICCFGNCAICQHAAELGVDPLPMGSEGQTIERV